MYYIYCYTNKINNHKYVGQTNNLKRRIREHSSAAFNPNASSYNDLIHKKIREYGEDNFQIDILEKGYTNDINIIPDYPIRKITANEQRATKIKDLLSTTTYTNKEIAKIVNSSEETVRRINVGQTFKDSNLSYPLRNL